MPTKPLQEHESSIAVIGMAARFPGARNITEYWRNLCEGAECIERPTREEALSRGMSPEQVDSPAYVNASAPLDDVECFDGAFFGYSSKESAVMDPQHRVFLECAYHALEDAGCDSRRYRGLVGVYAGCTMNTYLTHHLRGQGGDVFAAVGDMQTMLGNDKDFLATRVSYKLDLRGPSVAVQSSCSSSLVATHLAARALLDDECDMALAGGASVRLPHGAGYLSTPGGTSSPDGHCRAFDADAAGPVVGNGVGVVVLKRLPDALRDGDRIHAVIRGSAINNDGQAKSSYTAPSVAGQAAAISRALSRAGVAAADVDVVEAHGTATPLGDPIEVAALARAFAESTDETGSCWLGSVKPNIGHLDAAAGVAGLIKAVLMVKHRKVPPVVHFRRPNPKLDLEHTPFRVPMELVPLTAERPARAAVNSVAMGGTNAHVIVEEAPRTPESEPSRRRRHPVILSARTREALDELSRSVGQHVREQPGADVADLAYTLATGRTQWEYRRALPAPSASDAAEALSARGSRRLLDGQVEGTPRPAFLLAGQGSQSVGMGWRLAGTDPLFKKHWDTVLDLFAQDGVDLASVLDPSLGALEEQRARLAETDVTQPALFAVEWALGRSLLDCGVRPYALLGHSIGELAAAALAGVFTLESAIRIVAERGRLMAATAPAAMAYAELTEEEALRAVEGTDLVLAAVNGERLVSLAGTADDIGRFLRDVPGGRLQVNRAFHSPLVAPAAADLVDVVSRHKLSPPEIRVVSNVTGDYLTDEQATSAEYWGEHLRLPVRFADGVKRLLSDGVNCFFELSPDRSQGTLARATAPDTPSIPTLLTQKGEDATCLLDALTAYWLLGGEVSWATLYAGERRERLSLPLYPFARTPHWIQPQPVQRATPEAVGEPVAVSGPRRDTQDRAQTPAAAGRTAMQSYLTELWLNLLGGTEIGLHDDFFDVGGQSLLAMQMVTVLQQDGAEDLAMTTVFEYPTIAGLAEHLEGLGMRPPERPTAPPPALEDAPGPAPTVSPPDPVLGLVAELEAMSDDEVEARLAWMEETDR
ncbi:MULTISPECIES: type I polyketide synthase [unclassified Streptomyces]|uniref:type I polyketide synthase n=1 Tax=unclassified Streptomyces TaxID=2593676 RepID=UPI0036EA0B62